MGEEEGFENIPSDGPKSLQKCHRESEAEEEERRAGVRCHQDHRESSDDQPSELDAAAPVASGSLLSLVSLHCSPHQSFDRLSVDFDLELTAEVRVEDGSSIALLSSISPRFHSRKSGTILDHLPLRLKPQSSTWRPKQEMPKQRKKKHKRKRQLEDDDEDEERLSRSRDSSLTPLRYRLGYDSDHFSDKLGVDMLSLDGEAMDSDYPSLEDSPLPLRPITPPLNTKTKLKPKTGTHSKKKTRPGKKNTASEPSLRQKTNKSLPSLSSPSAPSIPAPPLPTPPVAKRARKTGKEKEKGGKKEGGRSGKSKKLSSGTRKGKLQSKVSVLVREGVSSTTGGSGSGKLGLNASSKDLPSLGVANSGAVVGGSIAVVFRRDNESRSPFLKPSSEPISFSGRNKDFGKARKSSTLTPLSSSSSAHISVLKSKKAKPSSTTSASSSSASSPSSFSLTKRRRKPGKKQREHREKGGVEVEDPTSSVSSSSANKPPPPPPPAAQPLPWSLQAGVDCTAGGVLALTALLFKMEEANLASRAKAQEFIQATSQILSQANQGQSQQLPLPSSSSSSSSQAPPPSSIATPPAPTPAQFILHGSLPLVGCTKTPPSHLHSSLSLAGGCAQTPPPPLRGVSSGSIGASSETGWDSESKDPEKYMKKLHTQERAVEEVKLAIKPYYQRKDITKEEYKDILRKAVHKICHSRNGESTLSRKSNKGNYNLNLRIISSIHIIHILLIWGHT
ncbi:hypothetical protein AAFF_G00406880 [Aldrovandia affinis]|uniref:SFR19-like C-terminal domain-containing protein n=1 Tax=Aldrovandia affinis TaxID=143900 RepID=A0AAD7WK94_9TELE|nr:hypothetical protein AAFF_G00406880 [Aldrovandia affinis]